MARVSDLDSLAIANRLNIGTADYVVDQANGGAATASDSHASYLIKPGMLINWIRRFDVDQVSERISALEDAIEQLDLSTLGYSANKIDELCSGGAIYSFGSRWSAFSKYVDDPVNGRRALLAEQIRSFKALHGAMEGLIGTCIKELQDGSMSTMRAMYVAAVCSVGDRATMSSALANAGTGATLAGAAGLPVALAGALVGSIVDVINSFVLAHEAQAQALLDQKVTIDALAQMLYESGSDLELSEDSESGRSFEFKQFEADENDGLFSDGG